MALYIVKAKSRKEKIERLRKELDSGSISNLRPFGEELHHGLDNARMDDNYAYWVEEDFARRHWLWKGQVCLIAISTTPMSIRSSQTSRDGTK